MYQNTYGVAVTDDGAVSTVGVVGAGAVTDGTTADAEEEVEPDVDVLVMVIGSIDDASGAVPSTVDVVPGTEITADEEADIVEEAAAEGAITVLVATVVVAAAGIIVMTGASEADPSTVDIVPGTEITVDEEVDESVDDATVVEVDEPTMLLLVFVMTKGFDEVLPSFDTFTTVVVAGVVVAREQ